MTVQPLEPNASSPENPEAVESVGNLDLGGLDSALSPLRRLVRYCSEADDDQIQTVRHIEANGALHIVFVNFDRICTSSAKMIHIIVVDTQV